MRKVKVNAESGIRNITIRVLVFSAASFRTRPRPRESEFYMGLGTRTSTTTKAPNVKPDRQPLNPER
jgi:hypothetical protein